MKLIAMMMKNKLATTCVKTKVGEMLIDPRYSNELVKTGLFERIQELLSSAQSIEQANILSAFEEGMKYGQGLTSFDSPAIRYYNATYGK